MSAFDPKRGGLVSDGARRHNFHYFNKDVMLSAMELLMDSRRVHSTRPPSRAASSRSQWASSLF
ncbi:MAG: hypothetical protein WA683_21105, partial [Pseudolabrys sp.]